MIFTMLLYWMLIAYYAPQIINLPELSDVGGEADVDQNGTSSRDCLLGQKALTACAQLSLICYFPTSATFHSLLFWVFDMKRFIVGCLATRAQCSELCPSRPYISMAMRHDEKEQCLEQWCTLLRLCERLSKVDFDFINFKRGNATGNMIVLDVIAPAVEQIFQSSNSAIFLFIPLA